MPKSIAIDATHFGSDQPTGVEVYVDNLLPKLSELLMAEGVAVSWIGHSAVAPKGMPEGVSWVHSPHAPFWSQIGLLHTLNAVKPDLFFTPSGLTPIRYKQRMAITVHDMASYRDWRSFSFGQRFRLKALIKQSALRSALILTPSHSTQGDIVKFWKIPLARITVTPLSFSPLSSAREPVAGIPENTPVIVFIGRIERKKNLPALIKGFGLLRSNAVLVLAGKDGFGSADINAAISELSEVVRSNVIRTGYVSEAQKSWLYARAILAVCPSPIEGFGIPALEAFAARVPVLAANAGSLPEICGDAATYVRWDDPEDWMAALERALEKAPNQKMLSRAAAITASYSWKATAEATAGALLTALPD